MTRMNDRQAGQAVVAQRQPQTQPEQPGEGELAEIHPVVVAQTVVSWRWWLSRSENCISVRSLLETPRCKTAEAEEANCRNGNRSHCGHRVTKLYLPHHFPNEAPGDDELSQRCGRGRVPSLP